METGIQGNGTELSARMEQLQAQVSELQGQISHLQLSVNHQLSNLNQLLQAIPLLTTISNVRYTLGNIIQSQEQNGVVMGNGKVVYGAHEDLGEDRNSPPFVPEGTEVTCVRCDYKWTPYARRPHQCARCRAPWWFPPKWRWQRNSDAQES